MKMSSTNFRGTIHGLCLALLIHIGQTEVLVQQSLGSLIRSGRTIHLHEGGKNMNTFHVDDTAVILIDHQVDTNTWARTTPLPLLQRNVIILAKFSKGTGMSVVRDLHAGTTLDRHDDFTHRLR